MLTNTALARIQALARSSFYGDLRDFLLDSRAAAVEDLLVAADVERIYRVQGKVNALDSVLSNLEHLRNGEDIDDTLSDNVATIVPARGGI